MNTRYQSLPVISVGGNEPQGGANRPHALAADGLAPTEGPCPRLVIRGESSDSSYPVQGGERYELRTKGNGRPSVVAIPLPKADGNPYAALTDYLNVTFPFPSPTDDKVRELRVQLTTYLGVALGGLKDRNRGLHGYKRSFAFDQGGAMFACGGQRGTALLSFPGEACATIPSWREAAYFFRDVLKARITRWDGAVDDFEGKHSVDDAVAWYKAGGFNAGGNKPSCSQSGNWIEPDGKGRTFYVGRRENGKLMRVYEKGKQLGAPNSPWVRFELELHNTDREIPFDVLLEPGKYVAGAYPCMAWAQEEASRIRTIQKSGQIGYQHLSHYLSVAYGRHLNVMLEVEGSAERVIEKLRREGVPSAVFSFRRFPIRRVGSNADIHPARGCHLPQDASGGSTPPRQDRSSAGCEGRACVGVHRRRPC